MSDLKRSLSEAAAAAFQAAGLSPDFGRVTASDRPDLADFQCNGALAAANEAVQRVTARMATEGGYELVETAYLEMAQPDLREAVARLAARGNIVVDLTLG